MKNKKKVIVGFCASFLFLSSALVAKELNRNQKHLGKQLSVNSLPTISVLNINNHAYWIGKDGAYTTSGSNNGTQTDYPKFTGLIYAEGM